MKIEFDWIDGAREPEARNAVSVCLYSSELLDKEKHIDPLLRFIKMRGPEHRYDFMVFLDRETAKLVPDGIPGVKKFLVTSDQPGFYKHFWRYAGLYFRNDYHLMWFRGADTPFPTDSNLLCERLLDDLDLDIFCSPRLSRFFCEFQAQCAVRPAAALSMLQYIEGLDYSVDPDLWTVDEILLSRWWSAPMQLDLRALIRLSGPLQTGISQRWLAHRLSNGNRTVVFKEHDSADHAQQPERLW